jgi:hypothetical protein
MEKDDFKKHESIVKLYQDVSTTGFLKICFCLKKDIQEFNKYVHQYLINNQGTDIRSSPETVFCEKINHMYHDKQKSFFSSLFSTLIILGTFLMVIVSYFALTK